MLLESGDSRAKKPSFRRHSSLLAARAYANSPLVTPISAGMAFSGTTPPTIRTPSVMTMHLYWTLYLGVLSFWAADESPNREDTLVVLDESMRLFVGSLSPESENGREVTDVVDVTQNR